MICNSFFAFASFCFVCSLLTFPFLFSRILPRPNLTFSRADVFSETFLSSLSLLFFSFFFSRHFSRFFAFPFRVAPTETCQPIERASRIKKLERRNCQVERSNSYEILLPLRRRFAIKQTSSDSPERESNVHRSTLFIIGE